MPLIDLAEIAALDRSLRLFTYNRAGVVSYHDADHLKDYPGDTRERLSAFFASRGEQLPDGRVLLLTHARILGYTFNPVSFFYCFDAAGVLRFVVAEVNNTFGDTHPYLLPGDGSAPLTSRKALHVSPFFDMTGAYSWRLPVPGDTLDARCDLHHGGQLSLASRLSMARRPLTDSTLSRVLLTLPFMTARVMFGIHWQALKLWFKGAPFHRAPKYDPSRAAEEPA